MVAPEAAGERAGSQEPQASDEPPSKQGAPSRRRPGRPPKDKCCQVRWGWLAGGRSRGGGPQPAGAGRGHVGPAPPPARPYPRAAAPRMAPRGPSSVPSPVGRFAATQPARHSVSAGLRPLPGIPGPDRLLCGERGPVGRARGAAAAGQRRRENPCTVRRSCPAAPPRASGHKLLPPRRAPPALPACRRGTAQAGQAAASAAAPRRPPLLPFPPRRAAAFQRYRAPPPGHSGAPPLRAPLHRAPPTAQTYAALPCLCHFLPPAALPHLYGAPRRAQRDPGRRRVPLLPAGAPLRLAPPAGPWAGLWVPPRPTRSTAPRRCCVARIFRPPAHSSRGHPLPAACSAAPSTPWPSFPAPAAPAPTGLPSMPCGAAKSRRPRRAAPQRRPAAAAALRRPAQVGQGASSRKWHLQFPY